MDGQDWDPQTIRGAARPAAPAAGARRNPEAQRLAALAASEAPSKPKRLSRESIATIQAYRRTHTLTQKDLDRALSFPPNTINHLESGTLAPTAGQLRELNRVLKTGLTLE